MQLSYFAALLLAAVSAAPHYHDNNGHQNKLQHRRRALLHDDLMALYVATATSATASPSSAASVTATSVGYHGPYADNQAHGGNTNAKLAVVAVTATSADAADATATSLDATSGLTDDTNSTAAAVATNIAAASRPSIMYSHAYNSTDDDEVNDNNDDDDSAASTADNSIYQKASPVPSWAIALVTIVAVVLCSALVAFFAIRYKRSRSATTTEKPKKKVDAEDALSSYKAFWELKRQSAGSFVSADATPNQLFAASLARSDTLPRYEETADSTTPHSRSIAARTPSFESAPPRGFLYQ